MHNPFEVSLIDIINIQPSDELNTIKRQTNLQSTTHQSFVSLDVKSYHPFFIPHYT